MGYYVKAYIAAYQDLSNLYKETWFQLEDDNADNDLVDAIKKTDGFIKYGGWIQTQMLKLSNKYQDTLFKLYCEDDIEATRWVEFYLNDKSVS